MSHQSVVNQEVINPNEYGLPKQGDENVGVIKVIAGSKPMDIRFTLPLLLYSIMRGYLLLGTTSKMCSPSFGHVFNKLLFISKVVFFHCFVCIKHPEFVLNFAYENCIAFTIHD